MSSEDIAARDEMTTQTARLEAALERIAAASARPPHPLAPASTDPTIATIAARLDTTIARLRAAIDEA